MSAHLVKLVEHRVVHELAPSAGEGRHATLQHVVRVGIAPKRRGVRRERLRDERLSFRTANVLDKPLGGTRACARRCGVGAAVRWAPCCAQGRAILPWTLTEMVGRWGPSRLTMRSWSSAEESWLSFWQR